LKLWPTFVIAAGVGVSAFPATAESVLLQLPEGEITIGATVIPFFAADIERIDRLEVGGKPAVNIILATRLNDLLSKATRGKIGSGIAVRLCGETLFTATIEQDLLEASFLIVIPNSDKAETVVRSLRNPSCASPLS
jgi:hypothetical protein